MTSTPSSALSVTLLTAIIALDFSITATMEATVPMPAATPPISSRGLSINTIRAKLQVTQETPKPVVLAVQHLHSPRVLHLAPVLRFCNRPVLRVLGSSRPFQVAPDLDPALQARAQPARVEWPVNSLFRTSTLVCFNWAPT